MRGGIKSIAVYTQDKFLFQKIRLDAPDGVSVALGKENDVSDIFIIDIDTEPMRSGRCITVSRSVGRADISIPFPLGTVENIIEKISAGPVLSLSDGDRCVYLRGERIKLTEVEFSLLSHLFKAGGEFVTREQLRSTVWDESTECGVVNVYIHYLREKLERHGEKIILSSRRCGYKIDERYVR